MRKNGQVTAFYLETLLLILVFIAIILVLTQVFGLGRMQSAEAKGLNDAVTLAQNAAEAVAASESAEELLGLLNTSDNAAPLADTAGVSARYDASLRPDPSGRYRVDTTWLEERDAAGTMVRSVILVYLDGSAEPLYRLETAAYHKGVGA